MRIPQPEAQRFIVLYSTLIGWCAGRLDPTTSVRDVRSFFAATLQDKVHARDRMLDDPGLIDEFVAENPHDLDASDLALVAAWSTFVRKDLVVERDLKRHTVFLDWTAEPVAYAVLSLIEEVVDLLPFPPPVMVGAVLLPWKGAIVCDGLVTSTPVHLGAGIRREIKDAYREAKRRGVVTSLDTTPVASPKRATAQQASRTARTKFVGRWRIVEMDAFDKNDLEMEGPAFIEIDKAGLGRLHYRLVTAEIDCRFSIEGDCPLLEFTWDGHDEHHQATGRGRATLADDGTLRGCIYTHKSDEVSFVASRAKTKRGKG